jgi:hypothetical protein
MAEIRILVIKDGNIDDELRELKELGFQVERKDNLKDGKKSLKKNQFDYILIGTIFLCQKDKKINGSHFGKRGGLNFIKDNIELLHEHIKDDKVIIYSWNKNWKDGKDLPSKIANELDIHFIDKGEGIILFRQKMQKILNEEN